MGKTEVVHTDGLPADTRIVEMQHNSVETKEEWIPNVGFITTLTDETISLYYPEYRDLYQNTWKRYKGRLGLSVICDDYEEAKLFLEEQEKDNA